MTATYRPFASKLLFQLHLPPCAHSPFLHFLPSDKNQTSQTREREKPQQRAGRLILLTFPFSLQCDTLHHMEEMTLTIYRLTGHFITTTLPQGRAVPFHLPKHQSKTLKSLLSFSFWLLLMINKGESNGSKIIKGVMPDPIHCNKPITFKLLDI